MNKQNHKIMHTLATGIIALVLGVAFIVAMYTTYKLLNGKEKLPEPTPIVPTVEQPVEVEPEVDEPEPVVIEKEVVRYIPAPQPTIPSIIYTQNNNDVGTVNNTSIDTNPEPTPEPLQTRNETVTTPQPAATPAPEPTPPTPLEEAQAIADEYDAQSASISDNKVRVTTKGGAGIVIDLIDGWQDRLRSTLRKVK